jgi:hypothetical protein
MVDFCLYCDAIESKRRQENCYVETTNCRVRIRRRCLYPPSADRAHAKGLHNRIAGISVLRLSPNVRVIGAGTAPVRRQNTQANLIVVAGHAAHKETVLAFRIDDPEFYLGTANA